MSKQSTFRTQICSSAQVVGRTTLTLGLAVSALTIGHGEISELRAQAAAKGKPTKPVCMVSDRNSEDPLFIVLPQGNRSALQAKRFKVIKCSDAFANEAKFAAWRDSICDLASLPLENIQEKFAATYGVRAQVLCGLAEGVSGQWVRRKGPKS